MTFTSGPVTPRSTSDTIPAQPLRPQLPDGCSRKEHSAVSSRTRECSVDSSVGDVSPSGSMVSWEVVPEARCCLLSPMSGGLQTPISAGETPPKPSAVEQQDPCPSPNGLRDAPMEAEASLSQSLELGCPSAAAIEHDDGPSSRVGQVQATLDPCARSLDAIIDGAIHGGTLSTEQFMAAIEEQFMADNSRAIIDGAIHGGTLSKPADMAGSSDSAASSSPLGHPILEPMMSLQIFLSE